MSFVTALIVAFGPISCSPELLLRALLHSLLLVMI